MIYFFMHQQSNLALFKAYDIFFYASTVKFSPFQERWSICYFFIFFSKIDFYGLDAVRWDWVQCFLAKASRASAICDGVSFSTTTRKFWSFRPRILLFVCGGGCWKGNFLLAYLIGYSHLVLDSKVMENGLLVWLISYSHLVLDSKMDL